MVPFVFQYFTKWNLGLFLILIFGTNSGFNLRCCNARACYNTLDPSSSRQLVNINSRLLQYKVLRHAFCEDDIMRVNRPNCYCLRTKQKHQGPLDSWSVSCRCFSKTKTKGYNKYTVSKEVQMRTSSWSSLSGFVVFYASWILLTLLDTLDFDRINFYLIYEVALQS